MHYKRIIPLVITAILLVTAPGCNLNKLKEIKAHSWQLESLSLQGLRSLGATIGVELENPSVGVTLTDIKGIIYVDDEPFVNYTLEPVKLEAKKTKVYTFDCTLELDPSKSILEVLSLLPNMSSDRLKTDLSAKAKLKGGLSKSFSFSKVPVKRFIKK